MCLFFLYGFFNCVGVVYYGIVLDCDEVDWDFSMDFNVKSMLCMLCVFFLGMLVEVVWLGGSVLVLNMVLMVFFVKGFLNCFVYGVIKVVVIGMSKVVVVDFVK